MIIDQSLNLFVFELHLNDVISFKVRCWLYLLNQLKLKGFSRTVFLGIANQRETTIVWDKETGKPVYKAILWHDARTQEIVDKISNVSGFDSRSSLA